MELRGRRPPAHVVVCEGPFYALSEFDIATLSLFVLDERPISRALDSSHHELIATALVIVLDEVALFVDDAPLLSKVIYISAREGCARGILDERRRGGEDCESSKRHRVSRRALARSDRRKKTR